MPKEELLKRELYTVIDGVQTDAPLHDLTDDKAFMDMVNEMYRTIKKTDK